MRKKFLIIFFFFTISADAFAYKEEKKALNFSNDLSPALSATLRLADRFYIRSVLEKVFGPKSSEVVEKIIFSDPSVFGGNCDPYEGGHCTSVAQAELSASSVVRQAKILQACELLVGSKEALSFSLKKNLSNDSPGITKENISVLYSKFHFKKEPVKEIAETLEKIGAQIPDVKDRWKIIMLILCSDPTWQIL